MPNVIQACPIGDSTALLSPVSGAIVLTNDFGVRIHAGLRRGLSPTEIAQEIADTRDELPQAQAAVENVLQTWRAAGLLADRFPGFPDPVQAHPIAGKTLQFGGTGGTARITITDEILAEQVDTILGHMTTPGAPDTDLTAQTAPPGYAIFRDGQPLTGRIELDAARFVILREMAETLCAAADVAAVFHAGCVAQNGRALMVCGDSGQGKSTLTFGLVAAGCSYLGDDHIPLHRDGRSALSFPTAAGVKSTGWTLPEITQLQTRHGLTPLSPRQGVRYVPLHQAGAPDVGEKRPVQGIIFPHFHPDAAFKIERIAPEQALIQALKTGSRLSRSHAGNLAPLCKFLNDVPAYALHYSSSSQSVPACLNLLSSLET